MQRPVIIGNAALVATPLQTSAAPPAPDMAALRRYRLARVREQLVRRDYAGIVLFDPINIRYATDSSNMQVWVLHNPVRYCFVPAQGPVVLFDFHGCAHLSRGLDTVDEVRHARAWSYFFVADRMQECARDWAAEMDDLLRAHGGGNRRLAVDRADRLGGMELARLGIDVREGQDLMEQARLIKSADEVLAMRAAIATCEAGIAAMHARLAPGISENEIWSELHRENIARGGEWIETRLLSSGPRTNPWYQECGERRLQAGDLLSFDTDLIGPHGYCADISRSWLCGDTTPSREQRALYAIAREQIEHNLELVRPGVGLVEFSQKGYRLPEDCFPQRYGVVAHGVGLCDEYPCVYYPGEDGFAAYDDVLQPGMTLCVESYVGRVGGQDGVKLEQQVLVTETGCELLSHYPFEDRLL